MKKNEIGEKFKRALRFLTHLTQKSTNDQITAYAAQSAFFILCSVFPFAILMLQLMRFAPISQESLLFTVDSIFPEYLLPTLHEILQEIYSSSSGLISLSIITTLWTSSNALYAVATGLDRIVSTEQSQKSFIVRLWSLIYTLAAILLMILAVVCTVFWQNMRSVMLRYRPHGLSLSTYGSILQSTYSVVLISLVFAIMYKFFPHKRLHFLAQIPGAISATIGCYLSSAFVSFYVSNFNAASMFGSLTTLALVMFWLYFCNYFLMLGAVINEVLRTEREAA
ncbi:MAG: YihY/virulence factor BrkB family protein [Lachnospiraceae bacterium]|nr:YihY/virulence factor BrkB family protein [Lachnospiraceae bacterium]